MCLRQSNVDEKFVALDIERLGELHRSAETTCVELVDGSHCIPPDR
jgi:hypothetical protein